MFTCLTDQLHTELRQHFPVQDETLCTSAPAHDSKVLPVHDGMANPLSMRALLHWFVVCSTLLTVSSAGETFTERINTVLDFAARGRHERHRRPKSICESKDWRKQSLKLIKEVPFAGLFSDLHGESKFEASGLVHVNGTYFVVFDRYTLLVLSRSKLSAEHWIFSWSAACLA